MNLLNAGFGVKAIILRGDTVLILQKSDGKQDLPGSQLEKQETYEEALRREIMEELGRLNLRILGPITEWSFSKRPDLLIKGSTWLCSYESGQISLSNEHSAFSWIRLNQFLYTGIYTKFGLDKFMVNFKTLSPERRKNYDRRLR